VALPTKLEVAAFLTVPAGNQHYLLTMPGALPSGISVGPACGEWEIVDARAFAGTDPKDDPVTYGLPVIRAESGLPTLDASRALAA